MQTGDKLGVYEVIAKLGEGGILATLVCATAPGSGR